MALAIRLASISDHGRLVQIWALAARQAHPFLTDAEFEAERLLVSGQFLPRATQVLVGEIEGLMAGFIALMGDEVGGLFVAPAWQRCGVGTALIQASMQPGEVLRVSVYLANHAARAFYRSQGFFPVGLDASDGLGRPYPVEWLICSPALKP